MRSDINTREENSLHPDGIAMISLDPADCGNAVLTALILTSQASSWQSENISVASLSAKLK